MNKSPLNLFNDFICEKGYNSDVSYKSLGISNFEIVSVSNKETIVFIILRCLNKEAKKIMKSSFTMSNCTQQLFGDEKPLILFFTDESEYSNLLEDIKDAFEKKEGSLWSILTTGCLEP